MIWDKVAVTDMVRHDIARPARNVTNSHVLAQNDSQETEKDQNLGNLKFQKEGFERLNHFPDFLTIKTAPLYSLVSLYAQHELVLSHFIAHLQRDASTFSGPAMVKRTGDGGSRYPTEPIARGTAEIAIRYA